MRTSLIPGTARISALDFSASTPYSTLHYVDKILDNRNELVESFERMLTDKGEIAEVLVNPTS